LSNSTVEFHRSGIAGQNKTFPSDKGSIRISDTHRSMSG
jgi:hypothetical protein